jgi:signal transduction histidine kinase
MHFDDRLATVLRARADGTVAARIQYRQLLDLIGTSPSEARGDLLDAAFVRLDALSSRIPAAERAAALAEPGVRLRSPRLLIELVLREPAVAVAAIHAARLAEEEWLDVIPALPIAARGIVRHRRDLGLRVEELLARLGVMDRGLPTADVSQSAETEFPQEPASNVHHLPPRDDQIPGEPEGIGAIVRRIEAFRRKREAAEQQRASEEAPRLPLGENEDENPPRSHAQLRAFSFATDSAGRVTWTDPGVAAMVTGLLLAARDDANAANAAPAVVEAFRRRQPIREGMITVKGAPSIAGEWQVDAGPDFDGNGRFTGYSGRFRRPTSPEDFAPPEARDSEADRIRQLLHELRTPVNAIQGFAEIIQQQLFGATPHEYRALAAGIAADAARMLAGFEELERLARLESGAMELEAGECDFAAVVTTIVQQLEAHTAPRNSGFLFEVEPRVMAIQLAESEAERLAWRLLATLAGAAAPGEKLRLRLRVVDGGIRMSATLPAALLMQENIFQTTPPTAPQALSAGMFGTGFALRLTASEAKAAGGQLEHRGRKLRLSLPIVTGGMTAPEPSADGSTAVSAS